jgi:hypothetical protein
MLPKYQIINETMNDQNHNPNVLKDKRLRKCESLMLRGTDSPTEISEQLGVSFNTAKSYISVVQERWSNSSDIEKLQTKREELIRKTEEIIREAWRLKDSAKNTQEATGALRTALMAIERLQKLRGLDNVPFQAEKPKETEIFEYAQVVNTLPDESKQIILTAIRKARFLSAKTK